MPDLHFLHLSEILHLCLKSQTILMCWYHECLFTQKAINILKAMPKLPGAEKTHHQPTAFAEKMKGGGFVRAEPQRPDRPAVDLHERH